MRGIAHIWGPACLLGLHKRHISITFFQSRRVALPGIIGKLHVHFTRNMPVQALADLCSRAHTSASLESLRKRRSVTTGEFLHVEHVWLALLGYDVPIRGLSRAVVVRR